jgi:hypothetical protein
MIVTNYIVWTLPQGVSWITGAGSYIGGGVLGYYPATTRFSYHGLATFGGIKGRRVSETTISIYIIKSFEFNVTTFAPV